MQRIFYTTAAVAAIVMSAPTHAAEWMTDFDAAKAKAKKEGKAILMEFTGSDWCGWCVRLRSTILDGSDFQQYAKDNFVLLEIDVPRNVNKIGAAQHARNRAIATQYNISTYPTILVLDADGTVLGGFIGGRDSLQSVISPLNEALNNSKKATEARKLDGVARAKALMGVYDSLQPELKPYFRTMRDEIALFDPNNTTGIHTEIAETERISRLQQQIIEAGNNRTLTLQYFDTALIGATPQSAATIQNMRMRYLEQAQNNIVMNAKTVEDIVELKEILLLIAEYSNTADAAAIRHEIETMFSDPAAVLEEIKQKQQKN